MHDLERRKLDT